jgi:hypothetical protein
MNNRIYGMPLREGLQLTVRMPLSDVTFFVSALHLTTRVGPKPGGDLDNLAFVIASASNPSSGECIPLKVG